jgi:hypothetical protein
VSIYDLGDLFAMAPLYPAMTNDLGSSRLARPLFPMGTGGSPSGMGMSGAAGFGGMGGGAGGGMFNLPQRPLRAAELPLHVLPQIVDFSGAQAGSSRTSLDQLIEAIQATISPDSWTDAGGECSIAPLGTSLLIYATEPMHKNIEALFVSFRERWGSLRTISVRVQWLWLSDAELLSLLVGGDDMPANPKEVPAYGAVDDEAWKKHLGNPDNKGDRREGYHAAITCTNGQTVHTVSGSQQVSIVKMIPVAFASGAGKAAKQEVHYQPCLQVVQEGAALQITPTASRSGKYLSVDVRSRVLEILDDGRPEKDERVASQNPQNVVAVMDRPLIANYRFSTTLRVPADRRMLVGGMTFEGRPEPGDRGLYLFLKASVQELHDNIVKKPSTGAPKKAPNAAKKPAKKSRTGTSN